MKINRKSFHTKNQVGFWTYVYIVFILAVLTMAFLLMANLSKVMVWAEEKKTAAGGAANQETVIYKDIQEAAETALEKAGIVILGNREEALTKTMEAQLSFIKEDYGIAESVEELKALENENLGLLIVAKEQLSDKEFQWLADQVWKGKNMFFACLPKGELLRKKEVRNLLGVKSLNGIEEFEEVRTSKELLLGAIAEAKDMKISAWNLELEQKTQVFASALIEGVENENLPPLIWRYIQGESAGRIYVCNGALAETPLGYGMISLILSDLSEYYIYPVINAFCVMVDGMPYTKNWESPLLEELYYRDALGMQRDLLFPEFKRCTELYEIPITYFSTDYEELKRTKEEELIYYLQDLLAKGNEIGLHTKEGGAITLGGQNARVVDWEAGFSFLDEKTGDIQLPVILDSMNSYEKSKLNMDGSLRGMGLLTLMVDLDEILRAEGLGELSKGEDTDWVEYCKIMESVLGTYQQNYQWLDKVTASETAQRIRNLLAMEPEYIKEEHGFRIEIGNFNKEAYFLLRANVPVHEVEGGNAEFIGGHFYLIRAQEETVHIVWK